MPKVGARSAKTEYITTAKFAKLAGVTGCAVRQAIDTGRIQAIIVGQGYQLNVKTELAKFKATMTRKHLNSRKNNTTSTESGSINVSNAALMERVFKAKKAKLEYHKMKEELISAEIVSREWQEIAQNLLSALLSIPDRIAPMIEGMGHREIHSTMTKEIKHACQAISDSLKADA